MSEKNNDQITDKVKDNATDKVTDKVTDKIEVIGKLLQLTDTVEEGIHHIELQVKELRYEEAILLLQDVVKAIATMQNAITPLLESLPASEVNPLTKDLMEQVGEFIDIYQNGKKEDMSDLLTNGLMPAYVNWKQELTRVLKPLLTN